MTVKMLLTLIFPSTLLMTAISCGLFGPDDEQPVDPLSFSWTVDTLHYPGSLQLTYDNIWGASPKDIYAVGHNFSGAKMFHFDGKTWRPVDLLTSEGGPISGAHGLEDIYGFASDDIWAVGHHIIDIVTDSSNIHRKTSLVIHYNGYEWVESDTIHDEPLYSVGGGNSDDFWVGGFNGIIYRYDGTSFTSYSMPLYINPELLHYIGGIVGDKNGDAYALLKVRGGGSIPLAYLLKFEAGEWIVFDSAHWDTWRGLWLSSTGTLYAAGAYHMDRWEDGVSTNMLDSTWYQNIYGTSDDNIYVSGRKTPWDRTVVVWHYNGEEFRRLPIPLVEDAYTAGIWTDGTEVFILTVIGNQTVVIHGK